MSNGTLLNEHDIALIKGCGISPFVISIDGPEWLHNKLRPYENGKDSYSDVCRSIALLRKNDIPVRASVVITNLYPDPLEIALHLKEQGVTSIKMTIIRGKSDSSFMPGNVHLLVEGYTGLFNRLESDFDNHDFSLFRFLTDDTSMRPLHNLLNRNLIIKRCPWGEQIAVDCKGDIYPCNYVIGNKKFRQGNIKDLSSQDADTEYLWIDNRPTCKDCWARYVCGGTCCYNAYIRNGAENSCEEVECIINKLCVVFCIKLYIKMQNEKITGNQLFGDKDAGTAGYITMGH